MPEQHFFQVIHRFLHFSRSNLDVGPWMFNIHFQLNVIIKPATRNLQPATGQNCKKRDKF
jgi:hypothetical protein